MTVLQSSRELAGLSRDALAKRARVGLRTIYRLEGGHTRRVSYDVMRRLAAALNVPAERIADVTTPPQPGRERPLADVRVVTITTPPILFVDDLARVLRCGRSTILAVLEAHPERLPRRLATLDRRPRWARTVVDAWIAGDPTAAGEPLGDPDPDPAPAAPPPAAACPAA